MPPPAERQASRGTGALRAQQACVAGREHPTLGAKPNLCVSADMEVTPRTEKSKGAVSKPACGRKGSIKLPRQLSTCSPQLRPSAICARAGMSSVTPCQIPQASQHVLVCVSLSGPAALGSTPSGPEFSGYQQRSRLFEWRRLNGFRVEAAKKRPQLHLRVGER